MKKKRLLSVIILLGLVAFTFAAAEAIPDISPRQNGTPGDVNGDQTVDLSDAILALKILAGDPASGANTDADVNNDGRIGSAEVIYILKQLFVPSSIIETFDEKTTPEGWSVVNNVGDKGWAFDPGDRANDTGGKENFAIADSTAAGETDMDTELRTPLLDFSDDELVQLTFKAYYNPDGESKAEVDVSTDDGETWTNVWTQTNEVFHAVTTLDISSSAAGQSRVIVRFRYYADTQNILWEIDDVRVEGISGSLTAPDGLSATVGESGITLEWTDNSDNESGFKIERSTESDSGFEKIGSVKTDPDAGELITFTDAEGLACDTTYYYRVQANNAAGDSENSNTANAKTAACQDRLTSVTENFDAGSKPAGWEVMKNSGTYEWVFDDPNDRKSQLNIDSAAQFALADGLRGEPINTDLLMPMLNLAGRPAVKLTFRTFLFFQGGGTADVDVSTNGGNNWTNVWRETGNINSVPFKEQTVELSNEAGGEAGVMLRFRTNDMSGVWIVDDVQLETMASPDMPTNLTASIGSGGVVNLSWKGDAVSDVEIERSADDSADWTKVGDTSDGASAYVDGNIKGLTTYDYRVRGVNAASASDYSNIANVTTPDRSIVTYDITVSYYDTPANTNGKKAAIENSIGYFADAVYEASNGVNKIGRVTFHTEGKWADKADVIWVAACHPNAYISGYDRPEGPNKRIEMCDYFTTAKFDLLEDEDAQIQAGYIMAHEWGHYFYSLYDEYAGSGPASSSSSPADTDTPVENTMMNNQGKAATDDDYSWLNFSTSLNNNTETNAQYRMYGASAWETLIRPVSEDPRDGTLSNAPVRLYHPELGDATPAEGEAPSLQLPTGQAEARSSLVFVWADLESGSGKREYSVVDPLSGSVRQIVIDRSESLSEDQLNDIKAAVKQLALQTEIGDTIGIISFDSTANAIYPLTTIESEADQTELVAAIDGITLSQNEADISAALQSALDRLTTDTPDNINRSVYLITAGQHATGDHPFSVIPGYLENIVRLYTFGCTVDNEASEILMNMAEQTDGTYRFIGDSGDLQKALDDANQKTSPLVLINIKTGSDIIESSGTKEVRFYADSTLGKVGVQVFYPAAQESVTITLTDPDSNPVEIPQEAFSETTDEWGVETTCFHSIDNPTSGTWTIKAENVTDTEADLFYWIDAVIADDKPTFTASVECLTGDIVEYPVPILLAASVGKDFIITGGGVMGIVETPDGIVKEFTLRDDGELPDDVADDGIYGALMNPSIDGDYHITVMFDNNDGTAMFTNKGVNFAPAPDGSVPDPAPWSVGENFERFAEIQLNVTGSKEDDHSDWYEDDPTVLLLDNIPVPGQIDFADDVDTFKITVPEDYVGDLVIRIDHLGLDMDPYLYIFTEGWTWELDDWLETEPTSGDYLTTMFTATPGETYYVEVWHYKSSATTGLYNISAGQRLLSENVSTQP